MKNKNTFFVATFHGEVLQVTMLIKAIDKPAARKAAYIAISSTDFYERESENIKPKVLIFNWWRSQYEEDTDEILTLDKNEIPIEFGQVVIIGSGTA